MSNPAELEDPKDVKKEITDADLNYPSNVMKLNELYEGEEYTISCNNVGTNGIVNVYKQTENSLKGNSAKKHIFQLWGGTLNTPSDGYENRILVNMNNGLNVRFQLKKTTLDDTGYYYCEYIQQGVANTFSQLKELVMWAKPSAPAVTGQDFYISKEAVNGTINYSEPQDILDCISRGSFPETKLQWTDQLGNLIPSENICFKSDARPEVFDCHAKLKLVVTREMDLSSYTCEQRHEALRGEVEKATKQIEVHYPPYDVEIKGNRTEHTVKCTAKAKPKPTFFIQIGKNGQRIEIDRKDGKYFLDPSKVNIPVNDVVYCHADNNIQPGGQAYKTVDDLFAAEPLLGTMHWIIIAACGGAILIGVIIMICCCCRKKDSNQKFENKSKYKQGHPSQVQMHQHNTMASNVSSQYEYKKQSHNERDIVGGYLAKAQSKEQIMDAYDNASSHPSEYHEQMSRTREILSRSRDALNRIEESTVEVTPNHMYNERTREDSFDDSYEANPNQPPPYSHGQNSNYPASNQYNYDDDAHLYQNDPGFQSNAYGQQSHHDDGPPPPPRMQSKNNYRVV